MSKAAVAETHEEGTAVERVLSGPERLVEFLKDTRQEMRKVVSPSLSEVQSTTTVVIVTVFAFAAYFALVDGIFGKMIDLALKSLTKH